MVQIETLSNGLRIVTEKIEGVRSASIGIWIGGGSRQETPNESGAAHFIEHMLFKGTEKRSAEDIARETDAIGGQMNAFTTKECTCFYARVLDTHLPKAVDILWDMVYHSKFSEEAVETERSVIQEEIDMYEDTPDDLCAEKLFGEIFRGSSLASPILGSEESLSKMTGAFLKDFHRKHYQARNTVVALTGSFDEEIVKNLRERFSGLENGPEILTGEAGYTPSFIVTEKSIEQNHLTVAFPGLPFDSPRRFTQQILSSILGGGVSSRLFQQVREQQGLCYTIYSYGAGHKDTGAFCIYTALNREMEQQALKTIIRVINTFKKEGPDSEELERAREQAKANVIMGLESTQSRMSHAGRSMLFQNKIMDPEEIIEAYDSVTREDVMELVEEIFDFNKISLSAVGNVRSIEEYRQWIQNEEN